MLRSNASYVINPDSFAVHPSLVGVPLARPSRRLVAMLVDLALVAVLVHAGGGVLLGMAAAYVFFRWARRPTEQTSGPVGRMVRVALRAAGALVLFAVAVNLWTSGTGALGALFHREKDSTAERWAAMGVADAAETVRVAEDPAEAHLALPALVDALRESGMDEGEVRAALHDLADESGNAWMDGVMDGVVRPAPKASAPAADPDAAAVAYAAAVEAADSAAIDSLRPLLGSALAADSLARLHGAVKALRGERTELRRELEEERNAGLLSRIFHLLDELGLEFGWTGLYFTAFVAYWKGQTPGKRLTGVRVVRLNGQPMTLWMGFERFGGYAAGLVTGLLGFAQVYWDHNRQMIHDKIVETVVVREVRGAPRPAPASPPLRGDGMRG